jgi:ribosomal protein S18 acetylase RimI-like enzyme
VTDPLEREVVEVAPGPERERWVPLLELADEPAPLREYLQDGVLFGLSGVGGAGAEPVAAILVIQESPDVAELRAVAVAEAVQGRGVGTKMIGAVLTRLAARGVKTVVVGTASSGVRQLAFYQRCGFRLVRVERDFFRAAKGYPSDLAENGIPIRDMVWMDRDLEVRSAP